MQPPEWKPNIPLTQNPSPWWFWGTAIFLGVMVGFTAIGAAISALVPYDYIANQIDSVEDPGPYPEDGNSDEQERWNQSKEEYDFSQALQEMMTGLEQEKPLQLTIAALTSTLGIVAIYLLSQQHRMGFNIAYAWVIVSAIGQIVQSIRMIEFYQLIPAEESISVPLQIGSQIGGVLVCNLIYLSVLVVCAINSKGIPFEESGFHESWL
tara:strand:+ start:3480 stop:4106 length:627 start_codon:yes stop_codon:yes gene_type:complete